MNTDQEFKQKKCSFESQTIKSWLLCSGLSQSCFLASIFNLVQRPRKDPLKWVYGSLNAWMGAQHSKISAAMHNFYSASSWKEERSALWWLDAQKNWVAWVSFSPGLFQLRKRSALCTGLRLLSRCRPQRHNQSQRSPKKFWYRCMHLKNRWPPPDSACTLFLHCLQTISRSLSLYDHVTVCQGGRKGWPNEGALNIQIY